jgi:arylsulfatase A-like enzyme
LDWNDEVKPGPHEVGFDYSFIMAATGDRVPCVYLENQRVVGLTAGDPIHVSYKTPFPGEPSGVSERDTLKMNWTHGHNNAVVNGIGRIGFMQGGRSALWRDEDMADEFTRRAVRFLEKNQDRKFFLYFATHDIHVPRVPHPRFVGRTDMGPRGDAIVQFDWSVGELLRTLERLNLATNTLVILTSDNGPVIDDGYQDDAVQRLGDHRPWGPCRGGKYSIFEAGTRVPFIVRWPGRVHPGVSDALVSQVDLTASFATLVRMTFTAGEPSDSRNALPALLGRDPKGRDHIIEHANVLAVRKGDWKYIVPGKGPRRNVLTNTELGNDPEPQLYDLAADPGERRNLFEHMPDQAASLAGLLQEIRSGSLIANPHEQRNEKTEVGSALK